MLTNGACVFCREWEGERVYVAVNAMDQDFFAGFDAGSQELTDLITGETCAVNGGVNLPAYSAYFFQAK